MAKKKRSVKLNPISHPHRTLEIYREFLIIVDFLFEDFYYWYLTDHQYTIYESNYAFDADEAHYEAIAAGAEIRAETRRSAAARPEPSEN